MKTTVLCTLCLLLISESMLAQKAKTNVDKKKAASLGIKTVDIAEVGTGEIIRTMTFDKKGNVTTDLSNVIDEEKYTSDITYLYHNDLLYEEIDEGTYYQRQVYHYDADSNLISRLEFKTSLRLLDDVWTYRYDASDRLIEKESTSSSHRFSYNDQGFLASELIRVGNGRVDTLTYEYNETGQLIEETAIRNSRTKRVYTYQDSIMVEKTIYNSDHGQKPTLTVKYEYDEDGLVTKETSVSRQFTLVTFYRYNAKGLMTEESIYNKKDKALEILSSYTTRYTFY